jgi:hypothetical protein
MQQLDHRLNKKMQLLGKQIRNRDFFQQKNIRRTRIGKNILKVGKCAEQRKNR